MSPTTKLGRISVAEVLAEHSRPLHIHEIASRLGLTEGAYEPLRRVLDDLSFDGTIIALPGQRFRLAQAATTGKAASKYPEHEGMLSGHQRGFGFVAVVGMPENIFIPAESMGGALHGDRVVARIVSTSRRGNEGAIMRIVKRRSARIAGTVRKRGRSLWLEPDDTRLRGPIVLAKESTIRVEDGLAAVATITRFPETPDENPEGELEAVLGVPGDPKVEVAKILVRESIEEDHPDEVVQEAEAFGSEVPPEALVGREDLTHLPLPTIDPEDARDHDDAVWVVRHEDGSYKAWIAIADVSHYVRKGTALDASALSRGNSIYLPDRAIPMLPRALSSNLCSLLPYVIRLCLCVEIDLDATGSVQKARIFEGYMRSAAKLTYQGVARALGLTTEPPVSEAAEALREDLLVMWDLSKLLRARRLRRGALDFDLPEARVVVDPETGAPIDVEKRAHDPGVKKAYQLIEELMLLANETVARELVNRNVPTIFRCHAPPDIERLEKFVTMCSELDVAFDIEQAADPKLLATFLKRIAAHPQKHVLHSLLLRAMKQANYDILNVGHFGLASTAYLHFTSPIRRYPDLVVHRVTRAMLHHEPVDRSPEAEDRLRLAASTASDCERRGMDVEREIVDLYRALYMRSHIGSVYQGTVTSVVGSGLFVNLDKPFVDVLVRLESIGRDVYELDESGLSITGVRSGERIKIGDSMLVQIEDVAILRRSIYGKRVVAADEEVVVAEEVGPRLAKHAQTRRVRKTKATQETKPEKRVKASKAGKTTKPAKSKTAPKTKTKAKAKSKMKKARR